MLQKSPDNEKKLFTSKPSTVIHLKEKNSMIKPKNSRGMTQAEAVSYENHQFNRWLKLFSTPKEPGSNIPSRSIGSKGDFVSFFKEMIPEDITYSWVDAKPPAKYKFVMVCNGNNVFRKEGTTLREIFEALLGHYVNRRGEYFRRKHGVIFPQEGFTKIFDKGLNPPEVVEKIVEKPVEKVVEKIVEKPVEKIVEKLVPGKPYDRLEEALNSVPLKVSELLDGNKILPNQFRHVHECCASSKGDGFMHLNIVLKP